MPFCMQIKHQDDNLCDVKIIHTDAAKYFIPLNAIRARAFCSHSMYASSFKKRARTGTLRISAFYYPASGENKRIKRKGFWLSIRPEDLHVFGRFSSSTTQDAHMRCTYAYLWGISGRRTNYRLGHLITPTWRDS